MVGDRTVSTPYQALRPIREPEETKGRGVGEHITLTKHYTPKTHRTETTPDHQQHGKFQGENVSQNANLIHYHGIRPLPDVASILGDIQSHDRNSFQLSSFL